MGLHWNRFRHLVILTNPQNYIKGSLSYRLNCTRCTEVKDSWSKTQECQSQMWRCRVWVFIETEETVIDSIECIAETFSSQTSRQECMNCEDIGDHRWHGVVVCLRTITVHFFLSGWLWYIALQAKLVILKTESVEFKEQRCKPFRLVRNRVQEWKPTAMQITKSNITAAGVTSVVLELSSSCILVPLLL